jgi:hypothetical protein
MFADGVPVPDLLTDRDNVPPSARALHTKENKDYFKQAEKKHADLDDMFEMFPSLFQPEDLTDCMALLRLEMTPLDEDIPFDWLQTDIESVFAHTAYGVTDRKEDMHDGEAVAVPDRYQVHTCVRVWAPVVFMCPVLCVQTRYRPMHFDERQLLYGTIRSE